MTVTIENLYTGNGSTTDYSFTFPYLDTTDIKVTLATVATTAYSLLNATTVRFDSAPGNGVAIRIYRETAFDTPKATFYPGSAIRANDLNDNTLQNLYVNQESNDKVADAWLTGDPTVISTESWYTTDDTKIASTKAIEGRIDAKIDTALTGDVAAGNKITITDNSPSSGQITVALTSGSLVNSDINASAAIAGSKLQASTGSNAGSMSAANFTKLDGIEAGATADQSNAEIRTAVEAATDSNVFTDADHTKLNAIEDNATRDQTAAEIRTLVESASDSNVFTDADHTKLNAIEASATADQTAAEIRTLVESASDSNVFTDADHTKLNAIEASATADQTSGEIKTLLQSDKLTASEIADSTITSTQIATGALDGRYYTETELNAGQLDNRYYTETESDARYFNISTGDTIKDGDTFPDNDTTIATTAAINDRIIDLVDDVGGFVPIANETSFPNANPDVNNGAGTLVSIKALSSNLTSNGSGVATISNGTVGNSTVTINGLANSTTYAANFGMIVETTTTLNTYTFHRQVPIATEVSTVAGSISNVNTVAGSISNVNTVAGNNSNVTTVAGANSNITAVAGSISNVNTVATNISNVNDFSDKYRVASSAPTSSLDTGDLYFDTSANELKVYNGSAWQGGVTATGNLAGLGANTFTGHQSLGDNLKVQLGTGNDLQIYHNGTDSWLYNSTGELNIRQSAGGDINLQPYGGEDGIVIKPNAQVELYYDNVKKFETTASGISTTGSLYFGTNGGISILDSGKVKLGDHDDLQIYHDGSNSYIKDTGTGNLIIQSNFLELKIADGSEHFAKFNDHAAVELYYDDSKKFETNSGGCTLTGTLTTTAGINAGNNVSLDDNIKLFFGTGDDLQIYHNGSNSFIQDTGTGNLYVDFVSSINFRKYEPGAAMEKVIVGNTDGSVELYHNNALRLNTSSSGVDITGELYIPDNTNIKIGGGGDLLIYHDGSHNYLDVISGGNGNLYMSANGSKSIYIRSGNGSSGVNQAVTCLNSGAVELYYDGVKYFETRSDGTKTYGDHFFNGTNNYLQWDKSEDFLRFMDGVDATFGNGDDFRIYHDGSVNTLISHNGAVYIKGDASNVVGIQPRNGENAALFYPDGAVSLWYDNSKKFETTSSGVTVTGTVSDSKGNLRSIPQQNEQGSAHTLVAADAGKHILADATVTAPPTSGIFSAGDAITIINTSGSDISIARGSGVTMYNSADGTDADRTLGTKGMATILCAGSNTYYISGAGLS